MKVLNYQAHHVLGVSRINFNLDGRHLFLVGGKNGQGKTSALKALLMALCGKRDMDWPDVALKDGEDEGWVKVELSGDEELHEPVKLTLELLLKRKRSGQVVEQFRILDSAGEEAPEPRTLLKRLYHLKGFDPQEFDRQPRSDRRKTLMELCGLDFSEDEVKIQQLYYERTSVNRDAKMAAAEAKGLKRHDDVPEEEVSAGDLMAELERRQAHNTETAKFQKDVADCLRCSDACQNSILKEEGEIARLQSQIEACKGRILQQTEEASLHHARWGESTSRLCGRVVADVDAIKQQIRDAGTINAKIRENKAATETVAKAEALRKRSEDLTAAMEDIKAEQEQKLKAAEWPIGGLSIDADGVLYNGLPYEQSSKSERILVSTMIGMALNPTLRLLVCEDGGDMDSDTLAALDKLLKSKDFQMVVELVTRTAADEAQCAVVIEDGKVK